MRAASLQGSNDRTQIWNQLPVVAAHVGHVTRVRIHGPYDAGRVHLSVIARPVAAVRARVDDGTRGQAPLREEAADDGRQDLLSMRARALCRGMLAALLAIKPNPLFKGGSAMLE